MPGPRRPHARPPGLRRPVGGTSHRGLYAQAARRPEAPRCFASWPQCVPGDARSAASIYVALAHPQRVDDKIPCHFSCE
jgi:hypothetical protein